MGGEAIVIWRILSIEVSEVGDNHRWWLGRQTVEIHMVEFEV